MYKSREIGILDYDDDDLDDEYRDFSDRTCQLEDNKLTLARKKPFMVRKI
jgi:hypothetical protein